MILCMALAIPRAPGRPRSEVSRAALIDAAYWQVIERGYGATTAEAIAMAAGAGKQTLYRWWPSKGRLVLEAFVTKTRERIDRPRENALRARDLEKFLIADLAALRPFADALRGLVADSVLDADLAGVLREEILKPRQQVLGEVLVEKPFGDHVRIAIVEAIEGAILKRIMFGEPLDESYARSLAAIVSVD